MENYPEKDIVKIVDMLDIDCPDASAYIDGHCSIAELVARLKRKNDRLLEALQAAYRKHVANDETIGWDELTDIMTCALPEVMGNSEFCDWVDSL